ncbi:MAG: sigma-70 family RNA polymerase sigma factor [Candidatus Riflebacteria bacterium]|nr:sigma-70 family RNA polymerase sigma factor [Candidatus Riflebacteria bacterium]
MTNKTETREEGADSVLVGKILSGQKNCYAEIITRFQNRIFSMTFSYTRNYEDARDLTQEIFIAVFNSLARFDKTRSLTNWVLKIAVHHCYQFLRKTRRPPKVLDSPADFPDPLDVQIKGELHGKLLKAFDNLTEDLKLTVWLYYFLERSCKESAEILEISIDLVKVRLFRARKILGEQLNAFEVDI